MDEYGDADIAVSIGKVPVKMADAGADVWGEQLFQTFQKVFCDGDASSAAGDGFGGKGAFCFAVQKDDALSDAGQKLGEQRGGIVQGTDGDGDDPEILFVGVKHFYGTGDVFHRKTSTRRGRRPRRPG